MHMIMCCVKCYCRLIYYHLYLVIYSADLISLLKRWLIDNLSVMNLSCKEDECTAEYQLVNALCTSAPTSLRVQNSDVVHFWNWSLISPILDTYVFISPKSQELSNKLKGIYHGLVLNLILFKSFKI